jgi:hypothetical protein
VWVHVGGVLHFHQVLKPIIANYYTNGKTGGIRREEGHRGLVEGIKAGWVSSGIEQYQMNS